MMRLICGSRKSATLACPRRFLCPLHPMAPISLKTLRAQWYSSIHIVGRAIGSISGVSRALATVSRTVYLYRRKQRAGSALDYVLLTLVYLTCTPAVARHKYVVHAARRVRGDVGRGGVAHLVRVRVRDRVRVRVRVSRPRWRRARAGTGGSGCCRGRMRPLQGKLVSE